MLIVTFFCGNMPLLITRRRFLKAITACNDSAVTHCERMGFVYLIQWGNAQQVYSTCKPLLYYRL